MKSVVEYKQYVVRFKDGRLRLVYPIDGHLIGTLGYEEGFVNMVEAGTHAYAGSCGIDWWFENAIPVDRPSAT